MISRDRRRSFCPLILGLASLSASLAPSPANDPPAAEPDFARRKYEAASAAYVQARIFYLEDRTSVGTAYYWSVRLVQSQVHLAKTPEERIAAYKSHLAEMREFDRRNTLVSRIGRTLKLDTCSIKFYLAEAEEWLAKEQDLNR